MRGGHEGTLRLQAAVVSACVVGCVLALSPDVEQAVGGAQYPRAVTAMVRGTKNGPIVDIHNIRKLKTLPRNGRVADPRTLSTNLVMFRVE